MKKWIIIGMLMVMQFNMHAITIEATTKGRIGRKSADCRGLGICFSSEANLLYTDIVVQWNNTTRLLVIFWNDAELHRKQPDALTLLRDRQVFEVEEIIMLPVEIVQQLRLPVGQIAKGKYPFRLADGKLSIDIRIE